MKSSENVKYYNDEGTISKVVNILKKYSYDSLKRRDPYFYISLLEKNTDEKMLKEYYPQFWRIKLIGLRQRIGKSSNYDIYYELENGYAIIFAIDIEKDPPILINAFSFSKNLKKFTEYLIKKYGKEMI